MGSPNTQYTGTDHLNSADDAINLVQSVFDLPVSTVVHHIREICVEGDDVKRVVKISYLHQPVLQGVPLDKISITVCRTNEGFELRVSTQCTSIVRGVRQSFDDCVCSFRRSATDNTLMFQEGLTFSQYALSFARSMLKSVLRKIEPNFDMDIDGSTQNV